MSEIDNEKWSDRDTPFEEAEPQEDAETEGVTISDFDGLILAPSDWTVGTVYEQIGKQIDLDPDFQRRNVWSAKAKSAFIESIFLGVPIPQVLLSSRRETKNAYIVLDGKQRLTTIKEFLDGKYLNGKKFNLRSLTVLSELNGKDWAKIKKDEDWEGRLWNATLRTAVLRGWNDESVLYEIFHRLNSGSVRLSPMELRMSLHPGEFLKFIIEWTQIIGPIHHLLRKREPDPRMADVELCIRHLAFSDTKFEYRGNLKHFLDKCCLTYNDQFADPDVNESIMARLNEMNLAIDAGIEIWGENRFCRKFKDGKYEVLFNRAIFDFMVGSLASAETREKALANPEAVILKFEDLSAKDGQFLSALENTTKTVENTRLRFARWYDALEELIGIKLTMPNIAG